MEGERTAWRRRSPAARRFFSSWLAAAGRRPACSAGRAGGRRCGAGSTGRGKSGRLQVMDWAGYEVKSLWAPYLKKYPGQKPKVHVS